MTLASGRIKIPQAKIAKEVLLPWWGTTHDSIYAYLSRYFKNLNFKSDSKISDIEYYLKKGHTVIVNWWDNLDPEDEEDGHYSLALLVDRKRGKLTLADPSGTRGIWKIDIKDFNDRWYDYLDVHGKKWVNGWLLWVDPKSRIEKIKRKIIHR